jgi:two-component system sensor histidine kinase UhpB
VSVVRSRTIGTGLPFRVPAWTWRSVHGGLTRPLLVGGAYYLGALIGLATNFPGTGIAILWPPNTILLAVLLVTPTRHWWRYGLAVFAAHVLGAYSVVPPLVMLGQFGGNASQAVIAALVLRRLSHTPWRIDSLRSASAVILVAGLLAPALGSILAAPAYVRAGWLPDVVYAWRVRVLSNLVTTLTLAPLLFAIAAVWLRGLPGLGPRRLVPRRLVEMIAVLAGLVAVGALVAQSTLSAAQLSLVYVPMPLLLWSAVRFGPSGLCLALFTLVLLFVGHFFGGPSIAAEPAANALGLQVLLIAIAVPLQILSALVEENRNAHAQIAESQQRYRMATHAGGVGVWDWDLTTGRVYVDSTLTRALGYADGEISPTIGAWRACVHPDDAARVRAAAREHLRGLTPQYEVEHRMVCRDGSVRWYLARGAVSERRAGRPVRLTGTNTDITERKRTEDALAHSSRRIRELAGRVISAQEQERRHVARELHDALNQQVAALAISISAARRRLASGLAVEPVTADLERLQRKTADLADAIRELSHGLHPAVLEHGGLVAALQSFATEFGQVAELEVLITAPEDAVGVAPDVALTLYRVVQEAIRNIARHSGARRAQIILTVGDETVELLVKDEGRGFDLSRSRGGAGLGLVSIEERVRLLQGQVLVTSRPGHGTDVLVSIPLAGAAATPASPAGPSGRRSGGQRLTEGRTAGTASPGRGVPSPPPPTRAPAPTADDRA